MLENFWLKIVVIALLGAVGTLGRFFLGGFVQKWTGLGFPWGTWSVNLLGCFLFGLLWTFPTEQAWISEDAKKVILTGMMGALTTFSTFAFESVYLFEQGEIRLAISNLAGQIVFGVAFVALGMALGRNF